MNMDTHPFQEYAAKYNHLVNEHIIKSRDLFADYSNEMQGLNTEINDRMRQLWENYCADLRASLAGDDTAARSSAAYRKFQSEYIKLTKEYGKVWQERQAKFVDSIQDLQSESRVRALDHLIEYFSQLRSSSSESTKPKDGGKSK
jgi:Skp family chaperone for outer membrane proteins